MPFVPVPNTASFAMCYTQYGQKMQNVFHLEGDTPFDLAGLISGCVPFMAWYNANLRDVQPASVVFQKIIARALDTPTSPSIEAVGSLPLAGTASASGLPANVTVAVKWGTLFSGRNYRGRSYHIGLLSTQVSGSALATGVEGDIQDDYNALLDFVAATPYQLVVVSKWSNHNARTTGLTTPVTYVSVENNVDSQRRRLNGRGE